MDNKDTTIIIEIDGMQHVLDIANLTARETGVLKRIGHLKGTRDIPDALNNADLEAIVAMAGIAMTRSGVKDVDYEKLLDVPINKIRVMLPGADEAPLAQAPEMEAPTPETAGTRP